MAARDRVHPTGLLPHGIFRDAARRRRAFRAPHRCSGPHLHQCAPLLSRIPRDHGSQRARAAEVAHGPE